MYDFMIRKAELKDAAGIALLMAQLGYPASAAKMEERLKRILARPEYVTFVAETPKKIVGLVGAYIGYALEFDDTYGRLTGLVVDEEWRGGGIGQSLMNRVEDWLKENEVASVILTSGLQRTESHEFYEHLGSDS